MNKDEMKMIKEMQKDLVLSEQDCVWLYEKEGYRKIADDEVVLKQSEIDEFRKDQAEVKFLKNKIKQETAREILQGVRQFYYDDSTIVLWLKNKYGIELE